MKTKRHSTKGLTRAEAQDLDDYLFNFKCCGYLWPDQQTELARLLNKFLEPYGHRIVFEPGVASRSKILN